MTLPTARAELVAGWMEQFAPRSALRVLVVEEGDRMVAALPLVARRERGWMPVVDLARNDWSTGGELLVDPAADVPAALDLLLDALVGLRRPLAWLDVVPVENPPWSALVERLAERGVQVDVHLRDRIACVDVSGTADDYEAALSGSHRYNVRRNARRLAGEGRVDTVFHDRFVESEIDTLLRRAFEIEHRSWKGSAGSSVLATPGMFEFYARQARALAAWGLLRLAFLKLDGRPIAFQLAAAAKGVFHSMKIGYDPTFANFGPGQVLRRELIRRLHQEPGLRRFDFQGRLDEHSARWANASYPVGRVVIAPRRLTGRLLLGGYRTVVPLVRRWRAAVY